MNVLHTEKDIEHINKELDDIMYNATKKLKTTLEPTIDDFNKVSDVVKTFIKDNKRIIYGGYAINTYIKLKNPKDCFYGDTDTPDIEFYSPTPIEDLQKLCDILHKKGFKYVSGREAQHDETYTVSVNFENICDISYMPRNIFFNIPIKVIDGLKLVHPSFIHTDALRMYNDPMTSYWRIEKQFKRMNTLQKYYEIVETSNCKNIKIDKYYDNKIKDQLKFVRKNIIADNKSLIMFGYYAYYYFISKSSEKEKVKLNIPFYEAISIKLEEDAINIYTKLKETYGNKITVEEYSPFFQFTGRSVVYLYDKKPILVVYSNNGKCIPYFYLDKKRINMSTFSFTVMMILIGSIRCYVNKETDKNKVYDCMIQNLLTERQLYFKRHDKTAIDKTPFKDFQLECIGETVEPSRKFRLKIIKKKKQGKRLTFTYDPAIQKPEKDTTGYIFSNTSGNLIINDKKKIIEIK